MSGRQAFEAALDRLSSRTVLVTAGGDIEFCDATFCNDLGYDRDTLLGSNIFDTLVPGGKQTEAYQAFNQNLIKAQDAGEWETPVRTAEGDWRSVSWLEAVDDGDETVVIGRLTDQQSPASTPPFARGVDPYRTLVDHFPNGLITLFDDELRFRVVGGPVFDEIDLSPDDLRGRRLQNVFPEENVAELRPLFRAALESETNSTTLPLEDRFFEVQVVPIRDGTGEILAGMTVSQDVTERRERERELQEARDRYKTFIENAPIPIFVGDEMGTISDLNKSAEELTGRSRQNLIGESMLSLHPTGEEDRYRAGIRSHVSEGGTKRYLPDGDQIYIVDNEGNRIPVEINASVTDDDGEKRVHSFFRDISDYVWYETALEELHESAGELVRSETGLEVAQTIVDTATDSLEMELVSVHLVDTDTEMLSPVTYSEDIPDVVGEPPSLPLTESTAGEAFLANKTIRVDDVRSHEKVYNPNTAIRSQLFVPIGQFGVIICATTTVGTFDQEDQRLLELLARNAESVYTRVNREQQLRQHERELEAQTETLQRVEELNTRIRKLTHIATQSETRAELEQQVCDFLSDNDSFAFGWIGELSPEGDELRPRTWSGQDQGYLDACSFTLSDNSSEPAVRTAENIESTVIGNIAAGAQREPWRREAIRRNFSSVISVPIAFQGVLYGVLTLYAKKPHELTDRVRDVLTDWGEFMGYAIKEIERTSAILSQQGTGLRFDIESEACPLLRIARDSHCTLVFEGIHEQDGDETTVFVRVIGCSSERFLEESKQASAIAALTQIKESDDGALFQITISRTFIASALAKYGLRLESIVGDDDSSVRVQVVTPPTIPVSRAVEIVSSEYPDASLLGTEELTEDLRRRGQFDEQILPRLTNRQREALELAYYGGYFESPKDLSGTELAEQMGISSSSFNTHLRAAERKLLDALLGGHHPSKSSNDLS
jgi:PAS domain S-box-containing protein